MMSDRPLKEKVRLLKLNMQSLVHKSSMMLAQSAGIPKSAQQPPLKSKYKKVITVLVGPGEEGYTVHKDLICANSPFFKAACNGNFVEGIEGVVRLPEDKPETFELLLEWLYRERVAEPDNTEGVGWHGTASLYVLAEKLQMVELKNAVVDAWVQKAAHIKQIPISEVAYVYCNTPDRAPLRRLLVDMVACGGMAESVRQGLDGAPWEFLLDLSVRLMQLRRNDVLVNARFWHDMNFYHECPATNKSRR